jgi:hypothetical protein
LLRFYDKTFFGGVGGKNEIWYNKEQSTIREISTSFLEYAQVFRKTYAYANVRCKFKERHERQ